jgi:hypothetical protein
MAMAMLTAAAPDSGAQKPTIVPPEEVARAVAHADSSGDWVALLRLAHPEALVRFRNLQTFQLRMLASAEWQGRGSPTTDSLGADTTLRTRWEQSRTRQSRFMLDSIFQAPDVDSLGRTSPDSVFARWVRWTRAAKSDDSAARPVRPSPYRVIGAVRASDTLAYVVVERPVEQPLGPLPEMFRDFPRETHQAEVMVMRRHGREWKSMLDGVAEPYGYSDELGHEE